jgi:hypothetical protein
MLSIIPTEQEIMAMRAAVLGLALSGLTATVTAQTVSAAGDADHPYRASNYRPRDVHAGRDHLSEQKVTTVGPRWPNAVQARGEAKEVMADLYRVTSPDDPALENGNKLCKGKPIDYLIVWKS